MSGESNRSDDSKRSDDSVREVTQLNTGNQAMPDSKSWQQLIEVLIADDHPLVSETIRAVVARQSDMSVIAAVGDGTDAVALLDKYQPDIVIMDINMPQMDGIKATRLIREKSASTHIIMFSNHRNATLVQQAIKAGASGYVLKQFALSDIPDAIRTVMSGKMFFSEEIPANYYSNSE